MQNTVTQVHTMRKKRDGGREGGRKRRESEGGKKSANARRIITYIMKPSLLFWMSLLMSLASFGANLNSDLYQPPAADFE